MNVVIVDVIKKVVIVLVSVEKKAVKQEKKILVVALAIAEKTPVKIRDVVQNNNKRSVAD